MIIFNDNTISQERFAINSLTPKFGATTIWKENDLVTTIMLLSLILCRILNFCNNNVVITNYPPLKMNFISFL